ncbi:MAG TPA: hypothetical protein VNG51_15475, partial [Ktedonobacteraceae bacterium]|nr:hypothetical protein [Ktedonobacteraceae bacterium]
APVTGSWSDAVSYMREQSFRDGNRFEWIVLFFSPFGNSINDLVGGNATRVRHYNDTGGRQRVSL